VKLYLIVRSDLTPAQQSVQSAHALQEFNVLYPHETKMWVERSNTLAMLTVTCESELEELASQAKFRGIEVACFREPDRSLELTAIALGPRGKSLTRRLSLALC
jgi:peptidyl-tRNA hydrolase